MSKEPEFQPFILHTKDGKRFGNAICYDRIPNPHRKGCNLYLCETDFGNRMRLSVREIDDHFYRGPHRSYTEWLSDRADVLQINNVQDECDQHDRQQEAAKS